MSHRSTYTDIVPNPGFLVRRIPQSSGGSAFAGGAAVEGADSGTTNSGVQIDAKVAVPVGLGIAFVVVVIIACIAGRRLRARGEPMYGD